LSAGVTRPAPHLAKTRPDKAVCGDIARTARSALDPKAQLYQDLIDRVLYRMAGLS
jgi:hypothetical protein